MVSKRMHQADIVLFQLVHKIQLAGISGTHPLLIIILIFMQTNYVHILYICILCILYVCACAFTYFTQFDFLHMKMSANVEHILENIIRVSSSSTLGK